jgi:hypothetical protein
LAGSTPVPLWDNNEIQFARLICELVANCDDLNAPALCESMDLDPGSLDELFERAHTVWENAKVHITEEKR